MKVSMCDICGKIENEARIRLQTAPDDGDRHKYIDLCSECLVKLQIWLNMMTDTNHRERKALR